MTKRILLIGDTHCGHYVGLTPPNWRSPEAIPQRKAQEELWNWFSATIEKVAGDIPFDAAIWGGDLIDGPGRKSGGSEQITTDMGKQVQIARDVVRTVHSKEHYFIRGTAYHTGTTTDFEDQVAEIFGGNIYDELNLDVNGHMMNFKHHTSRGSTPHGSIGAKKEKLWLDILAARGEYPKVNSIFRWHVHWWRFQGDQDGMAMTMPALQLPGSKYGKRCAGDYTVGFVVAYIDQNGGITCKEHLADLKASKRPVVQLSA